MIAFWLLLFGTTAVGAQQVPGDGDAMRTGMVTTAVALSSVPVIHMIAAFFSRKPDWYIWVLAAMGLSLAVGLPLLIMQNPVASLLAGLAAGAVVSLDRPEGTTWHNRAIAAGIVSLLAVGGMAIDVLFVPLAIIGPALPFTAMGFADMVTPSTLDDLRD